MANVIRIPDSLLTTMGNFKVLNCNQPYVPQVIIPPMSLYGDLPRHASFNDTVGGMTSNVYIVSTIPGAAGAVTIAADSVSPIGTSSRASFVFVPWVAHAGLATTLKIEANALGTAGNVTLTANGISINALIAAYNAAHPDNVLELIYGDGRQIPAANVILAGGLDNLIDAYNISNPTTAVIMVDGDGTQIPTENIVLTASEDTLYSCNVIDEWQGLTGISSADFTISFEATKTDWSDGVPLNLMSRVDAVGENGISIDYTAGKNIVATFLDATVATLTLTKDASTLTPGSHTITLTRDAGAAQVLYIDGVVADSDTEDSDTIGIPTPVTANISVVSLLNPVEITTATPHGLDSGEVVVISGLVGTEDLHGVDTLNGNAYVITKTAADRFTIPVDGHLFDARTSGGAVTWDPPLPLLWATGSTNKIVSPYIFSLNDAVILYGIVRNASIMISNDGTVTLGGVI